MDKSFIIIFALVFASCTGTSSTAQDTHVVVSEIYTVEEFQTKMDELDNEILLDVRTDKELEMYGQIEGAINVDLYEENFAEKIAALDTTKPIMVYCWSGGRSAEAASLLLDAGFKEVYDLEDGFDAWLKENEE